MMNQAVYLFPELKLLLVDQELLVLVCDCVD